MTEARLDSTDLVLLLLRAPASSAHLQNQVRGITRLEKLLFLLDQEKSIAAVVRDPFKFKAYDYGPYSREVYEAVEVLEAAGLIQEELVFSGRTIDALELRLSGFDEPEGAERRFVLTEDGVKVADLLAQDAPPILVESLTDVKERYGTLPLRSLIHYVYSNYPAYAERSKIRSEVLGD
jgi:uncharacterized protein